MPGDSQDSLGVVPPDTAVQARGGH
jgi:hypothetical protein